MSAYEVPPPTIKVEETKSNNDMEEPTKENEETNNLNQQALQTNQSCEQPVKLKDRKVKEFINNIVDTTLQTEAISEDQLIGDWVELVDMEETITTLQNTTKDVAKQAKMKIVARYILIYQANMEETEERGVKDMKRLLVTTENERKIGSSGEGKNKLLDLKPKPSWGYYKYIAHILIVQTRSDKICETPSRKYKKK